MQVALDEFLRNFPNRPIAWALRALVFPVGKWDIGPNDRDGHMVATMLLNPSEARDRLTWGVFKQNLANHPAGFVEAVLPDVIKAEPLERKLQKAVRAGDLDAIDNLESALQSGIINSVDRQLLEKTRKAVAEIIAVDEFDSDYLGVGKKVRTEETQSQSVKAA